MGVSALSTFDQDLPLGRIAPGSLGSVGPAQIERSGVDWLLFLSLAVVILLSGAVQYFNIFMLAAINLGLQAFLLWRVRFRISKKIRPAAAIICVYLIYSIFLVLYNSGNPIFLLFRFHDIFTALLVLNYLVIRRSDFSQTMQAVLLFFLLHGFLNWLLVNYAFALFQPSNTIKSYKFLFFFGMNEQYLGMHRSQGLFWEPGVYQIYLNVALHYFLFYARKSVWAGLSLLGIILTLSTTGAIIASLQMGYALFRSGTSVIRKCLLVLILLPAIVAYANFTITVIYDKISGDRSASFLARSFDTRNGIAIALEYPWGIGFDPNSYQELARDNVFNIDTVLQTDRGQTNGILILIYSTGFLWALVFLFFTFRQNIFPSHRTLFFLIIAGSMTTEPLTFSPFFFLFTVSGIIRFKPLSRFPQQ